MCCQGQTHDHAGPRKNVPITVSTSAVTAITVNTTTTNFLSRFIDQDLLLPIPADLLSYVKSGAFVPSLLDDASYKGEVRMPVELRIEFADGRVAKEQWNGRDRWYRLSYEGAVVSGWGAWVSSRR